MKEKILALLKSLGIAVDGKEQQLTQEIEKLVGSGSGEDLKSFIDKYKDNNSKELVETLLKMNKELTSKITDFTAKYEADEKLREENQKKNQEVELKKTVDTLIAGALKDKKITEAQKDQFIKLATADVVTTTEIIKNMGPSASLTGDHKADNNKGVVQQKLITPLSTVNLGILKAVQEQNGTLTESGNGTI